jgi:predicted PurR-regulated permease PerM
MSESRQHWSSQTKLVVTLLLFALAVYLLYRFRVVLPPLILALILAYILSPLVQIVERRLGGKRTLATILIYLVMLAILIALPLSIVPPLVDQTTELNLDAQRFLSAVEALLEQRFEVAGQVIDLENLYQQLVGYLPGVAEPFFGQTIIFAFDVISSLVWVVFILIVSFYLVKDGPELREWLEDFVPAPYRSDYVRLRDEINLIWSAFFRGQIVLGLVVASIISVAGFMIGLPFALAMGVLAGLLELLPSIGHGIWLIVASILALSLGSNWMPIPNWVFTLLVIGLYLVFQQFDLKYLIPRIIGRRVQLPPLVVILGIVTGAVLVGVLGIFLAAPTIASARVIGRYIYANLSDQDPFAESGEAALPPPDPQWWRTRTSSDQSGTPEDDS